MSAEVFVDTNILYYANTDSADPRHSLARSCVEDLWNAPGRGAVSVQVLQELHVNLIRKAGLAVEPSAQRVGHYLAWRVVDNDRALLTAAFDMQACQPGSAMAKSKWSTRWPFGLEPEPAGTAPRRLLELTLRVTFGHGPIHGMRAGGSGTTRITCFYQAAMKPITKPTRPIWPDFWHATCCIPPHVPVARRRGTGSAGNRVRRFHPLLGDTP